MAVIQEFFGRILPVFENKWTRKKFGAFVNRLPTELQQDYAELHAFLSTLPDKGKEYRRIEFYEADDEKGVTAYDFIVLLFNLKPNAVARGSNEAAEHIRAILDNAEEHLLHHVISCRECGTYKLCMSNILSSRKNLAGKTILFKNRALFTVREFMTELDAAGVPDFYCFPPENDDAERILYLYKQLPDSLKQMFFAPSFLGRLPRDIPLYIIRDALLFADNGRWSKLTEACGKKKEEAVMDLSAYIRDFLEWQRRNNGFRLGGPKTTHGSDSGKFNPREQAYLEICKPCKWLGKTHRDYSNPDIR